MSVLFLQLISLAKVALKTSVNASLDITKSQLQTQPYTQIPLHYKMT